MNLVDVIKNQLFGEVTGKLSSLLGCSETQIKSALSAAIPALLSAIFGSASASKGDALASMLNDYRGETKEKFASDFSQNSDKAFEQGENVLNSILGGSTLSGLTSILSKFAGFDTASVKKLLAMVTPFVMGVIAKQFEGKQITSQGLQSLFDDQKSKISASMPTGLSMSSIPGLSEFSSTVTHASQQAADAAQKSSASLLKPLLPVIALAVGALLAWQYLQGRKAPRAEPVVAQTDKPLVVQKPVLDDTNMRPDVATLAGDLSKVFSDTTTTLESVKDADSAEAAVPKLEQVKTRIGDLSAVWQKVPEATRSTIVKLVAENIEILNKLIDKSKAIPGVKEKLEPILNEIVEKFKVFERA